MSKVNIPAPVAQNLDAARILESIIDRARALEAIAFVVEGETGGEYFTRLNMNSRGHLLGHIASMADGIAKDAQSVLETRGAA